MVLIECFHLFKKTIGDPDVDDDDSCIAVKNTSKDEIDLQCPRNIYKKYWRILTSSPQHQLILGYICYNSTYNYPNFSIIDVKSARVRKANGLKAFKNRTDMISNSCNGLILLAFQLSTHDQYVIFNPLSNKIVTRISPRLCGGSPCGFFYHPLAREYRILYVWKIENNRYEYHLYLFGSKTWRTTFSPYFTCQPSVRRINGGKEVNQVNGRPTITQGALYWYYMGTDIMIFDVISEKLCFKPLPVCCSDEAFHVPRLVVKEDCLCCCYVHRAETLMDIWVLEDYAKWSWNRKYIVDLDWNHMIKYPRPVTLSLLGYVRVVSIEKDELVLFWVGRGMYSYHLVSKTVEIIQLSKSEMKNHNFGTNYYDCCHDFMAYTIHK